MVVVPVGSVTYKGQKIIYQVCNTCSASLPDQLSAARAALALTRRAVQSGKVGVVAQELYTVLTDLQAERTADKMGWLVPVDCA